MAIAENSQNSDRYWAIESEYKGTWWLPGEPQVIVPGIMTFSPKEGADLKLEGILSTLDDHPLIVLGEIRGRRVTLYKCRVGWTSLQSEIKSAIYASVVFLDIHFLHPESIKFKRLHIRYSYLGIWAFKKRIENEDHDFKEFTIKYTCPQPVESNAGGYKILIAWSPRPSIGLGYAKITDETWILVQPAMPQPYEGYDHITRDLQNVLTLAMCRAVYPLEVKGEIDTSESDSAKAVEVQHPKFPDIPITILQQRFLPSSAIEEPESRTALWFRLFGLDDVQDRIDSFFDNVISKADKLHTVYNLYAVSIYNKAAYLEHSFLSLAQALEIYHRRMYVGKYQEDDQYQKGLYQSLINAIPPDTDQDFKKSLRNRLKYDNEYSLQKRIKDTLHRYAEAYPILMSRDDRSNFANDVSEIRNALTHYSGKSEPDDDHIYQVAEKMKLLVEVCLLHELGIETNVIRERLTRNWKNFRGVYLEELIR